MNRKGYNSAKNIEFRFNPTAWKPNTNFHSSNPDAHSSEEYSPRSESQIGLSGVRALPLVAGINVGGYYFGPSEVRVPAEQT